MMAMTTKSSISVKPQSRAKFIFKTSQVRLFVERNTEDIAAFVLARGIRLVDWFPVMIIRFFRARCFGLLSGR
jgi:hypothetical protein